ncbi:nicotinate (nicotinamide) nucleotide adenylyltransferase [Microcoleus sp. LEGE 07076]|uniref:nicotinate (nicotinamide) nucleotide adenylyltransferase n=1 Tax=Microcoleus sp. LEGE 07076 TaxID=915322 RepID=UPI00187ED0C6|nr:nicotinate (nicotinamide) nucleotide adenylyltransferase [Microcoleus sp. LEGE 07076]MBE9188355.1 nicotinate (nicotinamide) nucleotide adenylyltransferase [Microcoleus sp. LEGE 07076]
MRKIAIFGGSFDPVHSGHLSIAQTAASQFALDRVIWVPDRAPGHKPHPSGASFEQRRFMVELTIADRPDFLLAPILPNPSGTSFAIDTVFYLQKSYPGDRWYWIIGSDALQTLPKWHRCAEIGGLCHWLVAPRREGVGECENLPGAAAEKIHLQTDAVCRRVAEQMAALDVEIRWQVLSAPSIKISSSHIRRCCAQNRDLRYLVPQVVRTYIATHDLYQPPSAES